MWLGVFLVPGSPLFTRKIGSPPFRAQVKHEEGQHLPPDPLLLAVRAAVVWSKRNGEQLLPNGEEPEDEDSEYEDDDTSIREFERNIDELKTYFPHSWRFMR